MARGRTGATRHRSNTNAELGARVDGYRIERIVSNRRGLNTIAEAATPRGERVTVDVLAQPLRQDRELRRRMGRLVPLRASVDHPNVLKLLRSVDGGQRLHMQSVPPGARTLADLLADGPLEQGQALTIMGQIAGALETARLKGLVHRALSPRSIVVEPGGEPKVFLTDFGIGAPRGRACELPSVLEDAGYRAPEEIRGKAPEPASNVYSLTCMLVECLTGGPPYRHSRPLATLHAQLTAAPPRVSERDRSLPAELDAVVASGMAKDPRERERSAAALVQAAADALGVQVAIPVVREPRQQPAPKSAPKQAPKPAPVREERSADAPPPAPAGQREERPAPPSSAKPLLRRAPVWVALALAASAAAGFATGNAGSSENAAPPAPITGVVREAPAKPVETAPVVTETIDRLDARRVAIRKRLNGARRAQAQAATAASLGAAYGAAEKRIAAEAASPEEEELAARLGDAEAAYRSLAGAARRTNLERWRAARAAAIESERELEQLLHANAWR